MTTFEPTDYFERMFAETYPKFTKNLVKQYDNLTYSEIRLCMFIRTGYPSNKLLKILNISTSTYTNLRSGIRKKNGAYKETIFSQYYYMYLGESLTNAILCI